MVLRRRAAGSDPAGLRERERQFFFGFLGLCGGDLRRGFPRDIAAGPPLRRDIRGRRRRDAQHHQRQVRRPVHRGAKPPYPRPGRCFSRLGHQDRSFPTPREVIRSATSFILDQDHDHHDQGSLSSN